MVDESPLFSVLIANYNNEPFISQTLESIKSQSYTNIEILIVDDASTDNSITTIKEHQKLDQRIVLYRNKENMGCGFTKNRCVELSKGELCGFVDPEDTISKKSIESMVQDHLKNPLVSLVFSNYYFCNEELKIKKLVKPKIPEGIVNFSQLDNQKISHFSTFKKNSYLETSGINPTLLRAVDQDLYLKLEEVGDVFYRNKNLYFYRYHNNGISAFSNKHKAVYWFFYVKYKTCERRKINKENFFAEEYTKLTDERQDKLDYKIGSFILRPVRIILKYYRRYYFYLRNKILQ